MKKILHLIVFLLTSFIAVAQPPTYFTSQGTSNNIYPFGSSTSNNKVQWLYLSTDFNMPLPTGQITKVYFRTWGSTYSATYSNLNIRFISTSITGFPSTTSWVAGAVPAANYATFSTGTVPSYTWWSVTLTTPYSYSAGDNLIVEIEHNNLSGSMTVNCQAGPGGTTRRLWGNYGSTTPSSGATGSYGDIGFDIMTGPPCPAPTGLTATNIISSAADLSWTAVTGSTGYDYYVDQNATPIYPYVGMMTGTGTSFTKSGLTPATNYYLHVRNKCSATNFSPWVNLPFTTLPPCKPPIGFHTTNLAYNSATINWAAWPSATSYDYLVDQSRADPVGSTGTTNTTFTSAGISPLTENTWYYVHIRSKCAGNEISDWMLDSFLTPIVCRAPELTVEHLNTDEAVTYWDPVPTAYEYEYAINKSSTPPAVGTKYKFTSIHTSALNDGVDYYTHVRCHCESVGVKSTSPWASVSFKTFAVGINDANGNGALSLSVLPNPVKEQMHIRLNGQRDGAAYITISDIAGKLLYKAELSTNQLSVDMGSHPAGTYILRYTDQSHTRTIKVDKH
jgi:hypothetical protein